MRRIDDIRFPCIAPSVLSADFAALGEGVRIASRAGARVLHLDVMDGHFVPNLTFGPQLVRAIRRVDGDIFFDVHLMMTNPLAFLGEFAEAGADAITIHLECSDDVSKCLEEINALGLVAGISLKPGTLADEAFPYLDRAGLVLIMTVEPGFGGQSMIEPCLGKIAEIREYAVKNGMNTPKFSVDGGINARTAGIAAGAGADLLVAGSAFYGAAEPGAAFELLTDRLILFSN